MKVPKLKYWNLAMAAGNYRDFETTRRIDVVDQVTVDITTGALSGQQQVYLAETVNTADDYYRWKFKTAEDLYVLRIPREYILREHLRKTGTPGIWEYRRSLLIPHCGVERVSVKPE